MEQEWIDIDLIEKYLDGALSIKEKVIFANKKETDEGFRKKIELMQLTKKAAQSFESIYVRKLLENATHDQQNKEDARRVLLKWIKSAAAIIIPLVLASISFYLLQSNFSNEGIISSYFQPYEPTTINKRTLESLENNSYLEGVQAYHDGEYAFAIDFLEAAPDSVKTDKQYQFYLYTAFLATYSAKKVISTDRYESAVRYFTSLKQSEQYREDAQWYLALVYLALDKVELARNELQAIASGNFGSGYQKEANKILQKLDSPWRRIF